MLEQEWYVLDAMPYQVDLLICVTHRKHFFSFVFFQFGGATAGRHSDMLFLDKKEIGQLLKIVRSQC
jgi:hypothetical protein